MLSFNGKLLISLITVAHLPEVIFNTIKSPANLTFDSSEFHIKMLLFISYSLHVESAKQIWLQASVRPAPGCANLKLIREEALC